MATSLAALAALLLAFGASAGEARPSLRDVQEIGSLFAVAVASEVADQCDRLAPLHAQRLNQLYQIRARQCAWLQRR